MCQLFIALGLHHFTHFEDTDINNAIIKYVQDVSEWMVINI